MEATAASANDGAGRPRARYPWVTIIIIALNLAWFAVSRAMGMSLTELDPDRLVAMGGNVPALTLSGEPWRLVTSMFLHGSLEHVGINMILLYVFGRAAEPALGRLPYVLSYLAAGLIGGLPALAGNGMVLLCGASGAVFGVVGAWLAYLVVHRARVDAKTRRRWWIGIGLLIVPNVASALGFFPLLDPTGVSFAAHAAGFAGGIVLGYTATAGSDARRRRLRIMAASLLVLGITAALLVFLPKSQSPYVSAAESNQVSVLEGKFQTFLATDARLVEEREALVKRVKSHEITLEEYARHLRDDLAPQWRALGADLASVTGLPAVVVIRQRALIDYVDARIAHLEALVAWYTLDDASPDRKRVLANAKQKEKAVVETREKAQAVLTTP